jgi:hypothetical protein
MNRENRKYYLQNFVFLTGLIVLLINDHYLKLEFSNYLTGKLSDFVGVLIIPMFLTFIFPKWKKTNTFLTGLFFVFWKSTYSQPLIDLYNQITFIEITRVVDYSDLIALLCLPISYLLLKKLNELDNLKIRIEGIKPILLLVPTIFIFMATSPPAYYKYTFSDGELKCHKCNITVGFNKSELLEMLKKNDYTVSLDSLSTKNRTMFDKYWKDSINNTIAHNTYYKIDTIIIYKDTITDFQFALEKISDDKTKIWINGMNIPDEIPDNKVERKLRKYYRRLIKNQIQQSISDNAP